MYVFGPAKSRAAGTIPLPQAPLDGQPVLTIPNPDSCRCINSGMTIKPPVQYQLAKILTNRTIVQISTFIHACYPPRGGGYDADRDTSQWPTGARAGATARPGILREGSRSFYMTNRPVYSHADLVGQKIRVQETQTSVPGILLVSQHIREGLNPRQEPLQYRNLPQYDAVSGPWV